MKTQIKPVTEKEEALAKLREIFKPGDTVYTVLRHVSSSGMTRRIDVMSLKGGEPHTWTGLVSKATGYSWDFQKGGLRVQGCGMDMGFEVVYQLGRALWPNGDGKYSRGRNGDQGPETDGGYMLKQQWL